MERAPFSKQNEENNSVGLKKGPWSAEEDHKLIAYIRRYGIWNWTHMPKAAGLARTGKSCRLRWLNYLRPNLKHGNISEEEEEAISKWHRLLGNRWSAIASKLPGRTDNEIKNYWNTHLKRRTRSEKSMQAPSANHPGSQVAVAPPQINTTLVKNDQPDILESSSLKPMSGLGKIIPGALGFEETSQRSAPMAWIDDEVRASVEGLGLDFWDNIVLPPVEDLPMEEDIEAMFIVSSGFELPRNYSHSEFSTNGFPIYDNLWENW